MQFFLGKFFVSIILLIRIEMMFHFIKIMSRSSFKYFGHACFEFTKQNIQFLIILLKLEMYKFSFLIFWLKHDQKLGLCMILDVLPKLSSLQHINNIIKKSRFIQNNFWCVKILLKKTWTIFQCSSLKIDYFSIWCFT